MRFQFLKQAGCKMSIVALLRLLLTNQTFGTGARELVEGSTSDRKVQAVSEAVGSKGEQAFQYAQVFLVLESLSVRCDKFPIASGTSQNLVFRAKVWRRASLERRYLHRQVGSSFERRRQ